MLKHTIQSLIIIFTAIIFACEKSEAPAKIELSVSNIQLPNISASDPARVTFTSSKAWRVELADTKSIPNWFSVSPMQGEAGTVQLMISVLQQNPEYSERGAEIKIKADTVVRTIYVKQAQKDAIILSKDSFSVLNTKDTVEVEVQSNIDYTINIPVENTSWIKHVATKALTGNKESFAIAENTGYSARTGQVIFKDKSSNLSDTINILQHQLDYISLSPGIINAPQSGFAYQVTVNCNFEYSVIIPSAAVSWIKQVATKGLREDYWTFEIKPNETYEERSAVVTFKGINSTLSRGLTVSQPGIIYPDREALMAIFNSTNGNNWRNKTNWGTNKPLSEWYGVKINGDGTVYSLYLSDNNLSGSFPADVCRLINLRSLDLSSNNLYGSLPAAIGNLTQLTMLELGSNNLSGQIPVEIGALTNLTYLSLGGYTGNNFSGPIPSEIGNLYRLTRLDLHGNNLSGVIPDQICLLYNLQYLFLNNNNLSGTIPAGISGLGNLETLHLHYNSLNGSIPASLFYMSKLLYFNITYNYYSVYIPDEVRSYPKWYTIKPGLNPQYYGYGFYNTEDPEPK